MAVQPQMTDTIKFIQEYDVVRHPKDPPFAPTDSAESIPIHLGDNPNNTSCNAQADNLPEVANVQQREYLPAGEPEKENVRKVSHLPELSPEQQQQLPSEICMKTQSETDTTSVIANIPDPLVDTSAVQSNESNEPEEEITLRECEQDENQINVPRRSQRVKEKAKRFTYPELGNALVTIIHSLFQGLNLAFTNSLTEQISDPEFPQSITVQPVSIMQRDLHGFNGGGCNPG